MWEKLRVVAEPGGAAAISALVSEKYPAYPGEHVGVIMSGENTAAVNSDLQEMRIKN